MKITTVPADALRPDLSLSPHHYLDRVTQMWEARFPGKTVKVDRRVNGYTVTVTSTFHTDANGERP